MPERAHITDVEGASARPVASSSDVEWARIAPRAVWTSLAESAFGGCFGLGIVALLWWPIREAAPRYLQGAFAIPAERAPDVARLLAHTVPGAPGLDAPYRRIAPVAKWEVLTDLPFAALFGAVLWWVLGGACAVAGMSLALAHSSANAISDARLGGFTIDERYLQLRTATGLLALGWTAYIVPLRRIQGVMTSETPWNRALGVAGVSVSWAGCADEVKRTNLPTNDAFRVTRAATRAACAAAA